MVLFYILLNLINYSYIIIILYKVENRGVIYPFLFALNNKKKSGGGSFYNTSVKRVGRTFAIHVRNAVNNRQLSYTEAYRLTGLYGKTYENFMLNSV